MSRIDGEHPPVPAPLMLLGAVIGFQLGAALGAKVLPDLGTAGAALVRNAVATGLLVVVARPSLRALGEGRAKDVAAVAVALAAINLTFYAAVARIPLAAVVTISFVGPLTVAVAGTRSRRDLVWVAMAFAGVALFGGFPGGAALNTVGILLACADGVCWAIYAVTMQRVARRIPGLQGLTMATAAATALLVAPALISPPPGTIDARTVALAAAAGVLTAVPYTLEFLALRWMRAATYGVLVSLEPAVAAVMGVLLLGQTPTAVEVVAIALVVIASVGASR
ncbi:MAG TPA: EamA family transporter [Gaiellales bacterium]|nr:EamA family transporter [Gaiellales bacterium]